MSKTKELTITCRNEVRIKADSYGETTVTFESPIIRGLLQDISWSDIVEFVRGEQVGPDEVFTDEQLEKWAEENGYVKA